MRRPVTIAPTAVAPALRRLPARGAMALIWAYRYGISPMIGPRCRYEPSCSEYGIEALERFGFVRGLWLTGARIARCHPWHEGGFDPLPDTIEPPAGGRYLGRVLRAGPACGADPAAAGADALPSTPCAPTRPPRDDGHPSPS
jgi:putative membrane protein insertion efficiency factor